MFFTKTPLCRQSTDDEFRAWGSAISTGLAELGLVQTADTGQINWTTVARPTTTNQSMGYEIWRFNDALQTTTPVFFKLEYGSGSSTTLPGIWLTVGQASNGSGTVTVNAGSVQRRQSHVAATTANAVTSYFSGNEGRVMVVMWAGNTSSNCRYFAIERANDTSGNSTSSYFTALMYRSQLTQPRVGESPGWESAELAAGNNNFSGVPLGTIDQKRPVSEIRPYLGGWGKPMTVGIGVDGAQWANEAFQNFIVEMYGRDYTFKFIPQIHDGASDAPINGMGIRWE